MAERLAYHLLGPADIDANLEARFSRFAFIVHNPAFTRDQVKELATRLGPGVMLASAEVNSMHLPIPVDGSEPQWEYEKQIKQSFPLTSLWRSACPPYGLLADTPWGANYSLTAEAIQWWKARIGIKYVNWPGHFIYCDDSPSHLADWLIERWKSLGLIDIGGENHFPRTVDDLVLLHELGVPALAAAIRSVWPGGIIANTGTDRVDSNLHGISLELSGIDVHTAAEAFKAQLRVARRPRLCIAWCKNQQELDEWRAVQQADPGLREVIVGIESSFTDWR